ncbi:GspH/FimT family protein [Lysobacter korlensis]|uniref:Type II secretion system protein H n=1 Tax=Lysobacter korlensis TaxID=553636 RepID=A0ABV6RSJ0_9GAMM
MNSQKGFTLLELLAVLAVSAVLLTIALPAWNAAMAKGRASAARAALTSTVLDSVRYSALAGVEVVACPSSPTGGCADTWDWTSGWIAFVDTDGNRTRETTEKVVHSEAALEGGIRLRSTSGRRRIVFQPNGGNAGSNVTFTFCHADRAIEATALVMSNAGRIRAAPATALSAAACEA